MEKVISNVDILYLVFKYLNLEEHIKLTKVCTQFRAVIIEFMWRNKYTKLEVFKTSENFILTNNITNELVETEMEMDTESGFENVKEEKTMINTKDFNKFLQLIANNIKVLVLSPSTCTKRSHNGDIKNTYFSGPTEFAVRFDGTNKFCNLTSITYKCIIVTDRDLNLLTRNCRNLEKLCLDDCLNNSEKTLVIGQDIKVATIKKMASLKYFEIKVLFYVDKDLYYDMNDILTKLNKEQLTINVHNFTIIDKEEAEDDEDKGTYAGFLRYCDKKAASANPLEELSIGLFRSRRIFNKFNKTILNNLKKLKKLTMESYAVISINEDFFKKLAQTCTQLTYLKLIFFEIDNFIPINTVNDLVLDNCSGLTWQDIKQILINMPLNSFSLMDTEYIGRFEYFNVTPTLESIHVSNCQRCHFKKLFETNNGENLKNLSKFIWYNNFADVPIYIATRGENLKILNTEPSNLLINNLYSLASLEKLIFRVKRKIQFSHILTILKHSTLKHFTLIKMQDPDDCDDYLIDYDMDDHELIAFEDMKTNLSFLNITLNSYFKIMQDFWFSLLRSNPKLLLMIRYNRFIHDDHSFLKYIVCHRKFPRRLKSINVCGYNIELREFRENFDAVIIKINSFMNCYKVKRENGYILL